MSVLVLRRELKKLASKKEEEELVIMTTPNSCVTSQNDNLMTPAKVRARNNS